VERPNVTSPKPRICFVVSSAMTVRAFLVGHIAALSRHYDVDVVLDAQAEALDTADLGIAAVHRARIRRKISPVHDLLGVLDLVRIFRQGRYAAVHSISPKAGLLTALAGLIARVPVRIHTYTGQVWAARGGASRVLLRTLDTMIADLNTHVLADSASQLEFLRAEGVVKRSQGEVLARGSICGVDTARFRPDNAARNEIRRELGIGPDAFVFVFLGRLTRDKGVVELARAFGEIAAGRDDLFLLCVGPDEAALSDEVRSACGPAAARLRLVGWTSTPEAYIAASDVACLPSYREGFGAAVIEAAAAGLPAIGSRIYGVVDAIEENATGLLFEAGNVRQLAAAMRSLADDRELRSRLGEAARARAIRDFSTTSVTTAMLDFYKRVVPVENIDGEANASGRVHGPMR
jgi:glycosyltransferase involved in cell wall biosynthesis